MKPMTKWSFSRNDGGASLLCDGVEVAHVPNIFSSDAANHGIPLGGMARAKWLCDILEKVNVLKEKTYDSTNDMGKGRKKK